MDERTLERTPGFRRLHSDLAVVFGAVMAAIGGDLSPQRIAAE
jgi:hypothetical protein